jgi:ferredoxin
VRESKRASERGSRHVEPENGRVHTGTHKRTSDTHTKRHHTVCSPRRSDRDFLPWDGDARPAAMVAYCRRSGLWTVGTVGTCLRVCVHGCIEFAWDSANVHASLGKYVIRTMNCSVCARAYFVYLRKGTANACYHNSFPFSPDVPALSPLSTYLFHCPASSTTSLPCSRPHAHAAFAKNRSARRTH